MYNRKDYYYDPENHYYTYDPNGYYAYQAENRNSFGSGQQGSGYGSGDFNSDFGTSDPFGSYGVGYNGGYNGGPEMVKKEKRPMSLTKGKLIALMLVMVMLAGLAGFGGARLAGAGQMTVQQEEQTVSNTGYNLQEATGSKMSIQQIANKCQDSVVSIRTESVSQGSWIREYVTEGAGSGVIFKSNGYILTNNHVVEGARKVTVTVDGKNDKSKSYEAEIVGTDAKNDVAVLKINAKGLTAATL